MQRIRIRYTKLGRVRFVSARDLSSVWERSLRRAALPIAYSEGFHPHAKVSFPDALGVGIESTGEYAELTFATPIDGGVAMGQLSAALPDGMDILTFAEVPDGASKLAKSLTHTMWELQYTDFAGSAAADAVSKIAAQDNLTVVHRRPKGDKTVDIRPVLNDITSFETSTVTGHPPTTVIRATVLNSNIFVRPDDFDQLLAASGHLPPDASLTRRCRVVQGKATEHGVAEALTEVVVPLEDPELAQVA